MTATPRKCVRTTEENVDENKIGCRQKKIMKFGAVTFIYITAKRINNMTIKFIWELEIQRSCNTTKNLTSTY